VGGDPVNSGDPRGLYAEEPDSGFYASLGRNDDGWGDPFEGLGSNSGMNGPMRPRTLACLNPPCFYWGSGPDGDVDFIDIGGGIRWVLPGDPRIGTNGYQSLPVRILTAAERMQWGALLTGIAGAWSNIVNGRRSQASQERDLAWAREAYSQECGHPYPRDRGREARRLGGDRRRLHDIITHQGLEKEDVLQEMLRLHPCRKDAIKP